MAQILKEFMDPLVATKILFKKNYGPSPASFFFIFVFSIQLSVNGQYKMLLMTGFELRTSGIGSEHQLSHNHCLQKCFLHYQTLSKVRWEPTRGYIHFRRDFLLPNFGVGGNVGGNVGRSCCCCRDPKPVI